VPPLLLLLLLLDDDDEKFVADWPLLFGALPALLP